MAILRGLEPLHRKLLSWFVEHAGETCPWPGKHESGVFLVNRPKGIHKPAEWKYALSVRQALDGPYADEAPVTTDDGGWTYRYFQENLLPSDRDTAYTNRALLACQRDQVPVGVIEQISRKPRPRYRILGIGYVEGWSEGFFTIRSPGPTASAQLLRDASSEK